jgi:nitroreductase
MDVMTAIYGRRAVRDYLDRAVARPVLVQLVEAAIQAPSALNFQPWAFGIYQGKSRLQDYSERARMHFLATFSAGADPHGRMRAMIEEPGFNLFYTAATLLVIYARPGGGGFAAGDCCLAGQNLMLAAHATGLATSPIGFAQPWLDLAEIKEEMGIPSEYTAVLPLIIGYPAHLPDPVPRRAPEFTSWM